MTDKKIDYIKYYKSSIEKNQNDPERVLHCLKKLDTLRINVQHLQETGIGRTVNAIRGRGLEGEAGELAKNLVNKWKSLVSESETINSKSENEKEDPPEKIKAHKDQNLKSSSSLKEKENNKKSKHHSSSSSSHHHNHHSSSSKEHKDKKSSDSKSSESKHKSNNSNSHTSTSTSSHHNKTTIIAPSSTSSSSKKRSIENESTDAKENETKAKRLKIESEKSDSKKSSSSSSSKSSRSKEQKNSSKKRNSKEDDSLQQEFDGSTGDIGFAEALMMFDIPSTSASSSSKTKKQLADKMVSVKSSTSSTANSSDSKHSSKSSSKDHKHKSLSTPSSSSSSSSASNSRPSTSTASTALVAESSRKSLETLTQPPKLLIQKPKLDLLPDIVSDIVIPDYRPLPLNTAIKDYIDSNFGSNDSTASRHMRKMEEAIHFSESFSSKANRTKVFSGNSKTRTQIPTLFDMCIRILQENIDFLECTGGVPFSILKPVLERAKPDQLAAIEYYNPYLLEESDVLWKPHCTRKWKNKQPSEMETWREMYERCTREDEEKLNRLTQNIKHHQEISSNGIQKTKMAYVDSFVKPPRGIMRKQEQFGTNRKLVASPAARVEALKNLAPNIVSGQTGDVRLRIAAGLRDDAQQVVGRGSMQRGNITKKAPLMAKILQKFKR